MKSLLATERRAQPALIKMNLRRLHSASDIQSEKEFTELLAKELIIFENVVSGIGKRLNAEEIGEAIGIYTGLKVTLAHSLEHNLILLC